MNDHHRPNSKRSFSTRWRCSISERIAPIWTRPARGNVELRAHVERIAGGTAEPGSFLEQPATGCDATATVEPLSAEAPGTVIGPYKLLQQIGEGGMGVVFMAEQTEPIQRTVALKIIKPGMDTRQVIARFEAERQALAMMDHPNIAKVLDAGTTDTGRPYFVMELVKGVPITKYCDEKHLPLRAAAGAVHAGLPGRAARPSERHHPPRHQAHRTCWSPSTTTRPVPKVIDFGVAKATARSSPNGRCSPSSAR